MVQLSSKSWRWWWRRSRIAEEGDRGFRGCNEHGGDFRVAGFRGSDFRGDSAPVVIPWWKKWTSGCRGGCKDWDRIASPWKDLSWAGFGGEWHVWVVGLLFCLNERKL